MLHGTVSILLQAVNCVPSGMDEETVTPTLFITVAQPDGGTETDIPCYEVIPDTGPQGYDCQVKLRMNPNQWYIFYSTPTGPVAIEYTLNFQVVYGGCLDDARNERDMDEYQGGRQTCGTWTFGIDGNGTLTNFSESYY